MTEAMIVPGLRLMRAGKRQFKTPEDNVYKEGYVEEEAMIEKPCWNTHYIFKINPGRCVEDTDPQSCILIASHHLSWNSCSFGYLSRQYETWKTQVECKRCSHRWKPRKTNPKACPGCGSANW